jgi:hypothetical protein
MVETLSGETMGEKIKKLKSELQVMGGSGDVKQENDYNEEIARLEEIQRVSREGEDALRRASMYGADREMMDLASILRKRLNTLTSTEDSTAPVIETTEEVKSALRAKDVKIESE